jgi:hypothetical protein
MANVATIHAQILFVSKQLRTRFEVVSKKLNVHRICIEVTSDTQNQNINKNNRSK